MSPDEKAKILSHLSHPDPEIVVSRLKDLVLFLAAHIDRLTDEVSELREKHNGLTQHIAGPVREAIYELRDRDAESPESWRDSLYD